MSPFFLRWPITDGFLPKTEFVELDTEAVHLQAVRVVPREKTFFEKQELVFGSSGVVDDGNKEALEVDLDPSEQLGQR